MNEGSDDLPEDEPSLFADIVVATAGVLIYTLVVGAVAALGLVVKGTFSWEMLEGVVIVFLGGLILSFLWDLFELGEKLQRVPFLRRLNRRRRG